MIRVVIRAASPALRAGLAALVQAPDIEVVAGAADGSASLYLEADAVVIDPANGIDDVEEVLRFAPEVRVVVLGPVAEAGQLARMLAGRAWAYLGRDSAGDRLQAAIRGAYDGFVVIDSSLASDLLEEHELVEPIGDSGEGLTPRESEVLQLVAMGLPNKSIAQRLHISEHTVKFHVASIVTRLGAASRAEAVRIGARRGLVEL